MKSPAKRLFAACLATIVAAVAPGIFAAAAESAAVAQDLVKVRASDQVTTASWSRQSDSYTLQVVLDRAQYAARQSAIYAANKAELAANPGPITTITREQMERLDIIDVADALTRLVPRNFGYMPSLTGDPRVAGTAAPPLGGPGGAPGQDRRRAQPQPDAAVNQPWPPQIRERRVEAWLLKGDGTQILPVAYRCIPDSAAIEVSYGFSIADSTQAVAAAIRIDDDYFIEKLQPLQPTPTVR